MKRVFEGSQFRVTLEFGEPGVRSSSGVIVSIETEDDENWFPLHGEGASDHFGGSWLPELAGLLEAASEEFTRVAKEEGRYPHNEEPKK